MNNRIKHLKHSDIKWPFDGSAPFVSLDTKPWPRTEFVDPFPCYVHQEELVNQLVEVYEKKANLKYKPYYFNVPYESQSRTNGCATKNEDYSRSPKEGEAGETPINPYIIFHGKRICIHPKMTEYLVGHELSHITIYNLEAILGVDYKGLEDEYCKLRSIKKNSEYGAMKWHTNTTEIMTNDCRVILYQSEPHFWQHPVEHPQKNQKVVDYWHEMKKKYLS